MWARAYSIHICQCKLANSFLLGSRCADAQKYIPWDKLCTDPRIVPASFARIKYIPNTFQRELRQLGHVRPLSRMFRSLTRGSQTQDMRRVSLKILKLDLGMFVRINSRSIEALLSARVKSKGNGSLASLLFRHQCYRDFHNASSCHDFDILFYNSFRSDLSKSNHILCKA